MKIESNWTYPQALKVIQDLKAHGLDAGVTVGAIHIQGDPDEIRRVCEELELPEPFDGLSDMQSKIIEQRRWSPDWQDTGR
jgi:diphthamide synthase (EF-2-diphthine--ammonia ligase)